MERQNKNAIKIGEILEMHPAVKRVRFANMHPKGSNQKKIYQKQFSPLYNV